MHTYFIMKIETMAVHTFSTPLLEGDNQTINITFNYFLPEYHKLWQDPRLGSITLLEVLDHVKRSILSLLSIDEYIKIRHKCWSYIESNHLIIPHTIAPIR